MLSLSKKADYALLALSYIASHGDRPVNAREISAFFEIPAELLAKILQRLAKAELLTSAPGPTGGYKLARAAERISVGQAINAVEGQTAITHCLKTEHNECDQRGKCTIRTPLERINDRLIQMLGEISIAEMSSEDQQLIPHPSYILKASQIPVQVL